MGTIGVLINYILFPESSPKQQNRQHIIVAQTFLSLSVDQKSFFLFVLLVESASSSQQSFPNAESKMGLTADSAGR
jgi:hypothetical protein